MAPSQALPVPSRRPAGAFFLRLDRDGQVSEENRYFDLIGVMQQLGQT